MLGGGVTKAGDRFWDKIRQVARETALPEIHFEIVPAALGDEAPLWGAVALAEDSIEKDEVWRVKYVSLREASSV